MKEIQTVLGNIAGESLGFCQCHEHLCLEKGHSFQCHSALCIDQPDKTLLELLDYAKGGGCAVVDAQPVGCGRNAQVLQTLSRESGVHIIASTGFHKLCFYQEGHWIFQKSAQELADLYTAELTVGMSPLCDTCQPAPTADLPKAGQIKTALDVCGLTNGYETVFAAAAIAAKNTNAPVMIHVEQGADPMALLAFFLEEGLSPSQLIFCHMDRAVADFATHLAICKAGCYLEYDTVGRFKYHSDDHELDLIAGLLDAGYGGQLLMSLDVTNQRLLHYGGEIGLTYIQKTFAPQMEARNMPLQQIFVENPKQAFSFEK